MERKFAFLFLFAFAIAPCLFSASLEELTGSDYAGRLRSDGTITEAQLKNPVLKLLPRHDELRQFVNGAMAALAPGVAVETLYLYGKPVPSPEFSDKWSDTQRANLFNQALALSTLTGIQYYSASRKAMRTFYEFSRVIDNPETKNPLPDPVYTQPPVSLTLYARQKDLSFGDNIYRYDFKTARDAFFFAQENMTALNYGIIPAVGKNKLRSVLAVIDCGDFLLIYAVSMAKAASVPGMGDKIRNSFGNRAEAVLKWFTGRADSVFFAE